MLYSPWVSMLYIAVGIAGVFYFKDRDDDYLSYYASILFMTIAYIVIFESKSSFHENGFYADTHSNGVYMIICSLVYLTLIKKCVKIFLSNAYVLLFLCFLLTAPIKWYDVGTHITISAAGGVLERLIGLFVVVLDALIVYASIVHARESRSDF